MIFLGKGNGVEENLQNKSVLLTKAVRDFFIALERLNDVSVCGSVVGNLRQRYAKLVKRCSISSLLGKL